jgi:carboxymethylenebutenolidase
MIEFPGVANPAREGPQPQTTASGRLFKPHSGVGTGLLVLHPWWGLNQTVLDYAARLASEGFVVLAPDLFGDGEPPATTIEDAERRATASEADDGVLVEQRALGAADWLVEETGGSIGAIGFSFGAAYALWLGAKRPDKVQAIAVYYGTAGPVKGQAPVVGHFATDDQFEPAENIDDLEKQLTDAGREVTLYRYEGTKHWFAEHDRPEYDAPAAAMAYSRTLHFLNRHLGE